jgi:hypothetical protein
MKTKIALLVALLGLAGCSKQDEVYKDGTWRDGLTRAQAAAVQRDKDLAHQIAEQLSNAAGEQPAKDSTEYAGLLRLKTYHDEFLQDTAAGNLKTAAPKFRKQLEGKTLADLAAEQQVTQR